MIPLPMPVAIFTNIEVVDVAKAHVVLAEGHDVDVVVDEDVHADLGPHEAGDVETVPARHDRRVGRTAGGVLDRTGARCRHRRRG